MMLNEVFQFFSDVGRISLLEIEASNIEWHILTRLLNCAIIEASLSTDNNNIT